MHIANAIEGHTMINFAKKRQPSINSNEMQSKPTFEISFLKT